MSAIVIPGVSVGATGEVERLAPGVQHRLAARGRRSAPGAGSDPVSVECQGCGRLLEGRLTFDAKTAPGAIWDRAGARATVPNTWSLPAGPLEHGGSCPGATAACQGCYAANLEGAYPSLRRLVNGNLETIEHALECGGIATAAALLGAVVARSRDLQRQDGVARPVFRWHQDGDIFSERYARAIRRAVLEHQDVDHWIYTRTLGAVRLLQGLPGLRLFVSVDRYNWRPAARVAARWGVPVAILEDTLEDGLRLLDQVQALEPGLVEHWSRAVPCPATHAWKRDGRGPAHLVGVDGRRSSLERGAPAAGACIACGVCLPGGRARPVIFVKHGGQTRALETVARVRLEGRS
jgi:hypothetical protein